MTTIVQIPSQKEYVVGYKESATIWMAFLSNVTSGIKLDFNDLKDIFVSILHC